MDEKLNNLNKKDDFAEKIRIFENEKLIHKDLIVILKKLNFLRNHFAHNLEASFSAKSFLEIKKLAYKHVRNKEILDEVSSHQKALFTACVYLFLAQMTTQVQLLRTRT